MHETISKVLGLLNGDSGLLPDAQLTSEVPQMFIQKKAKASKVAKRVFVEDQDELEIAS